MKEEKEQTVIDKTLLYLENYREMERYIKEAVSETSQVPDIDKYNISAERAFLQSVRECRAETVILFEHLKQALASLKEDAEAAGELHAEHYMRYMDDMVILGKSKKKLHKMHRAIETYLNDNLDLEIKGDWQVFRFEYPVMKDGKPVLDENRKQVTKGRMLDFMGFQFHHDRTTIRKSNIEAARRKANHISKQDKISWYNASVMLSYMGLFKHTDTYNYYIEYIKPKINVKKLKRIVSKHSRKENEQHDRLEKGDRNTAGTSGGNRQDIVSVNGLSA